MDTNSKRQKVDHHPDSDLLSDLPLSIIHIILASIPIRDALKTSLLSTKWRYTWTTLPQLVFNEEYPSEEDEPELTNDDLITGVLFRHNGPIHKFQMSCLVYISNVDEWIFCLARNGIRELMLDVDYRYRAVKIVMHSSLYSCKKLTYLRLVRCKLDPVPLSFKGFLFLRCLCLDEVWLSSGEINSLVAVCPLLESFELRMRELEIYISAPNLKYMQLRGDYMGVCININAPLMTDISVELVCVPAKDQQLKSSLSVLANSLAGFPNLQKLRGSDQFTKYLSLGNELCHHPLVFHHLKLIELDYVDFRDVKQIMKVANLLIGSPNLQGFKIRFHLFYGRNDVSDSETLCFKDLIYAPNLKLEKLSDVYVSNVGGRTLEVEFLKLLLESSPRLQTMSLHLLYDIDKEKNRNNLTAKLQGCNWASPIVNLCYRTWDTAFKPWRYL